MKFGLVGGVFTQEWCSLDQVRRFGLFFNLAIYHATLNPYFRSQETNLPSITIKAFLVFLPLLYFGLLYFHLFHLEFNYLKLVGFGVTLV